MKDSEKAKFILKLLSGQKLEFNGAKEAFSFTQSYQWLLDLAKKMEESTEKDANK